MWLGIFYLTSLACYGLLTSAPNRVTLGLNLGQPMPYLIALARPSYWACIFKSVSKLLPCLVILYYVRFFRHCGLLTSRQPSTLLGHIFVRVKITWHEKGLKVKKCKISLYVVVRAYFLSMVYVSCLSGSTTLALSPPFWPLQAA